MEELEKRVAALEQLVLSQQRVLAKFHTVVYGHQQSIEAFARILNIELEQQPAPQAPLN